MVRRNKWFKAQTIDMKIVIKNMFTFSFVRFGNVLSHVDLQMTRLFAGVIALLTAKRFLTGV